MNIYCEIVVKGQLDPSWSRWLGGLAIKHSDKGEAIISGQLRDQAAFYGLIAKIRDMALCITSIKYTVAEPSTQNHDSTHRS